MTGGGLTSAGGHTMQWTDGISQNCALETYVICPPSTFNLENIKKQTNIACRTNSMQRHQFGQNHDMFRGPREG